MLNLYRVVKILTVVVAVGSLAVQATRLYVDFVSTQQQADGAALRANRDALKAICNWQIYEVVQPKLREAYRRAGEGTAWSSEHLGADWNYDYFYDFGADEIYCARRANPGSPAILGEHFGRRTSWDHPIVRIIICFIAVCGAALAVARIFR